MHISIYYDTLVTSPKAVEQGCICAVLDNLHGKGLEGGFYITVGCKLHDPIEGKG